jgi:AraC-like DNA-binding protein
MAAVVIEGSADDVGWKMASRAVEGELSAYVRSFYGYHERCPGAMRRRELPSPQCVVIVEIGPPIRIYDAGQTEQFSRYPGGFVVGLDDRWTITQHEGEQRGVQLNLSPIGARVLFGLPMHELARRVVPLREVLPEAVDLAAQLHDDTTWDQRFDRLERLLCARLSTLEPRTRAVAWAFDEIVRTDGGAPIHMLSRKLGYSHKHVIAMFRDQLGLTPKHVARLVRFDALTKAVRSGRALDWAALALEVGFADQAHLVREVRHFSGLTPSAMRSLLMAPITTDPG